MKELAFPKGRVVLQHHHNDDWRVAKEFCFYWEERGITICVWMDFLTDHASTPSIIPDMFIDNTGPISNGAVPHDMYYKLLSHSTGIPFRCIYDMLGGKYLTKRETDLMFAAANKATNEMGVVERWIAKRVKWNIFAKWRWMPKEEWDANVIDMELNAIMQGDLF